MSIPTPKEQLMRDGFCLFPGAVPPALLERLREAAKEMVESQNAEEALEQKTTGSMISVKSAQAGPVFADLIALPTVLAAFETLGFADPRFSSGYVISKPGYSPRLFWHQDWGAWDAPESFAMPPAQMFAMFYLVDTSPENGCLRVIPGSHLRDNPLHPLLEEAHTPTLTGAHSARSAAFSTRPDEVDVPVRAGDLVLGDARLLHAAHANSTNERRTVITLWYHPDMGALGEETQAFISTFSQEHPQHWPAEKQRLIEPLRPVYQGTKPPLPWNRTRPVRREESA